MMDRETMKQLLVTQLRAGRCVDVKAKGVSMMPMLWPKMTLRVKACDPRELKRGDIALFDIGGASLIAHRVVKNDGEGVTMRGDSVMKEDGRVKYERILGIVTGASIGRLYVSARWWGARWYGIWTLGLSPVTHTVNNVCAKCLTGVIKIKNGITGKR